MIATILHSVFDYLNWKVEFSFSTSKLKFPKLSANASAEWNQHFNRVFIIEFSLLHFIAWGCQMWEWEVP